MAEHPQRASLCRNCGTPVSSNYCPYCGQDTALQAMSAWEFAHEFASHYVAVEGKLWRTLALLALQPGRLTREFLAGRRQRFIAPLRLYISASFLFFAASQIVSTDFAAPAEADSQAAGELRDAAREPAAQLPGAVPPGTATTGDQGQRDFDFNRAIDIEATPEQRAAELRTGMWAAGLLPAGVGLKGCARNPAVCSRWRRRLATTGLALTRDPEGFLERFRERFHHTVSYAMFLALPIFAALLALAYRRRRMYYGEHLVFALHVHSFWFLLGLVFLFTPGLSAYLPAAFGLYGLWAMKRVYGGRWSFTALRGLLLAVLYSLIVGLGAAALAVWLLAT
jgi:hypothetical protein